MNSAKAASGIDMLVQEEPAEWWQIVSALTPLVTSLVLVYLVIILAYAARQETQAVVRAERWRRAEWAIAMALDDMPQRRIAGLAVLEQLSTERLVDKADTETVALARALLSDH